MKTCERCGSEFEGTATQKYCSVECREFAAVERKLGYGSVLTYKGADNYENTCGGKCCKAAKLNIANSVKGWVFMNKKREFGVKAGENIVFCPWCGGRLEK